FVESAPRSHRRQRVCHRNSAHVFTQRLQRVVEHRTAVIAASYGGDGDVHQACALDRVLHGEIGGDLSHTVSAVDHKGRAVVFHDSGASCRIHAAVQKFVDVIGNSQHTVGMNASHVGGNQRIGQQSGVV